MKQSLYIITHKAVKNIYPKNRKLMLVGAKGKNILQGYCADSGENKLNISDKNKNYCELTGLYYFHKNDKDAEVFGLEHYRRIFKRRKFYLFRFPFLRSKDIEKILTNHDLIVPKAVTFTETIYEQYCANHIRKDLDKTIEIIKYHYPEYTESMNRVFNAHSAYLCNMFIAKANVIREYCDWLFDILFTLEKKIDLSDRDDYQKRVFGFLSERLFTVWLEHNSQYKKYECRVEFIENEIPFVNILKKIKI